MKSYEEITERIKKCEKYISLGAFEDIKNYNKGVKLALQWVIDGDLPLKEGDVYKTADDRIGVIVGGTCGYIKMQVLGDIGVYNFRRNDINDKFSDKDWKPVKYLFNIKEHIEQI